MDEMAEDWRSVDQPLIRLEHDARQQPCLAMKTDGPANTETRERAESAAPAVQAKHTGIDVRRKGFKTDRKFRPVSRDGRTSRSPLKV